MNKDDLEEILSQNFTSSDARQAFISMSREDQLLAILGVLAYVRSKLANLEKRQLESEREVKEYRLTRERREELLLGDLRGDGLLSTTQKIISSVSAEVSKVMAGRFDWGVWFRDKVLPAIVTAIVFGILYFTFRGGTP